MKFVYHPTVHGAPVTLELPQRTVDNRLDTEHPDSRAALGYLNAAREELDIVVASSAECFSCHTKIDRGVIVRMKPIDEQARGAMVQCQACAGAEMLALHDAWCPEALGNRPPAAPQLQAATA